MKKTVHSFPSARLVRIAASFATALFLSACANRVVPITTGVESEQEALRMAMNQQLDAAIARVSEQPRWTSSLDDRASFASFNSDAVSVSYQGSAADLLKAVAASRGVSFSVTGPQPHLPIFVFIEANGQSFEEFLSDLHKQLGQRAGVVWTDNAFELRYR